MNNKKPKTKVWFWESDCRYVVIFNNAKKLKWKIVSDEKSEAKTNIFWVDCSTINERFKMVSPWQMVNHFPGMPNIARKNKMGQNLNKMLKVYPREYAFYPRTWVLPSELAEFRQQFDDSGNAIGNKVYIIKPDAGCQGRGIFLTSSYKTVPLQDNVVAQTYIKKPLLLDGFKFDLRIYVFVASVKPLRVYLFKDGLVRMCTETYTKPTKENLSNSFMHLTNYAVNKRNQNFHQPTAASSEDHADDGSKRSLQWFMHYIASHYNEQKVDALWRRIGTMCVRTILSIMPTLSREYDMHFKQFTGVPVITPVEDVNALYAGYTNTHYRSTSRTRAADSDTDEDDDNDNNNNDGRNTTKTSSRSAESTTPAEPTIPDSSSNAGNNPGYTLDEDYKSILSRGSRCFEVLGLDIMIDSKLKPWLIEVNHLPSFGTDSPLDMDVKDRLMSQVLKALAVLPDDEYAYQLHHKREAAKRLQARRFPDAPNGRNHNTMKTSSKPTLRSNSQMRKKNSMMSTTATGGSNENQTRGNDDEDGDTNREVIDTTIAASSMTPVNEENDYGGEEDEEEQQDEAAEGEGEENNDTTSAADHAHDNDMINVNETDIQRYDSNVESQNGTHAHEDSLQSITHDLASTHINTEKQSVESGNASSSAMETVSDEKPPLSSERVDEIKKILREIYEVCSPEKVNKVDKLLQKYRGREEEFLEFVHLKYNIPYPPPVTHSATATTNTDIDYNNNNSSSSDNYTQRTQEEDDNSGRNTGSNTSSLGLPTLRSKTPASAIMRKSQTPLVQPPFKASRTSTLDNEKASRSVSPSPMSRRTRDNGLVIPEDKEYKRDVLAEHVSNMNNDPWMVREASILTQFIRIFPPEPSAYPSETPTPMTTSRVDKETYDTTGAYDSKGKGKREGETVGGSGGEEDGEDDNGDDEEDDYQSLPETADGNSTAVGKKKKKPIASYEDIIYQVFEMERRLMNRFNRPLRSRSESADTSSQSRERHESRDTSDPEAAKQAAEEAKKQADSVNKLYSGLSTVDRANSLRNKQLYNSGDTDNPTLYQPEIANRAMYPGLLNGLDKKYLVDHLMPIAAVSGSVLVPVSMSAPSPPRVPNGQQADMYYGQQQQYDNISMTSNTLYMINPNANMMNVLPNNPRSRILANTGMYITEQSRMGQVNNSHSYDSQDHRYVQNVSEGYNPYGGHPGAGMNSVYEYNRSHGNNGKTNTFSNYDNNSSLNNHNNMIVSGIAAYKIQPTNANSSTNSHGTTKTSVKPNTSIKQQVFEFSNNQSNNGTNQSSNTSHTTDKSYQPSSSVYSTANSVNVPTFASSKQEKKSGLYVISKGMTTTTGTASGVGHTGMYPPSADVRINEKKNYIYKEKR